jgi:hypothetical protein
MLAQILGKLGKSEDSRYAQLCDGGVAQLRGGFWRRYDVGHHVLVDDVAHV